jgi:cobalamin biosynthesis protein CobD
MVDFIWQNLLCIIIAFALDMALGDPDFKMHPVRLIGLLIGRLERTFYASPDKVMSGAYFAIAVVGVVSLSAYALLQLAMSFGISVYMIVNSLIIYFSISIRSMVSHADAVADPLDAGDLDAARSKLALIVSRDTTDMEPDMIARSTVESISENFTDGVLSPMLFSIFFGGVGAAVFKAVSTLDSMVGYRNEQYDLFGRFSARLDDLLNFVPARVSLLVIDITPTIEHSELDTQIAEHINEHSRKTLKNALEKFFPPKMLDTALRLADADPQMRAGNLSKQTRKKLTSMIKNMRLNVEKFGGFERAVVTSGGVALNELDQKTMGSKIVPNLYFAGEVIDIDGPTGGFNLQACWSTGRLAGISCAQPLAR